MFVKLIVAGVAAVLVLGCGMFMAIDRVGLKSACACATDDEAMMPHAEIDAYHAEIEHYQEALATTLNIRSFVAAGAEGPFVISKRDMLLAALLMMDRYKADAVHEASARADRQAEEGDMASAAAWHRILDAIERLQAQKPAEGEPVH